MKMVPRRAILAAATSGRQTSGERRKLIKTRRARRKALEAELRKVADGYVKQLGEGPEAMAEFKRAAPRIVQKHGFA